MPTITHRLIAAVLVVTVTAVACGSDPDGPTTTADATAEILAAAAHELVTVDHTFGSGPPPFTEYLVQERLDPAAGTASGADESLRALTTAERAAIEARLAPLGPVTWIEDPDDYVSAELEPTVDGAVILGFGEPAIDGTMATAPVSLWCGGLCGTWFTYELGQLDDGGWEITGIDGPVAVS